MICTQKIGIDVHKIATQACILTDTGEYEEHRIRTERDALTKLFGPRTRARIVLEASTESEWVARHLESLGHEVIVADPNFAPMYASRSRKVKTDKRDARALCEACHLGAYRATHRASDHSRAGASVCPGYAPIHARARDHGETFALLSKRSTCFTPCLPSWSVTQPYARPITWMHRLAECSTPRTAFDTDRIVFT